MITKDDLINAGITVEGDGLYELSAVEWIGNNTNIPVSTAADIAALSPSARLFIQEYTDIMNTPIGAASEIIEGLSQSFCGTDKSKLIMSLARSLLGDAVKSGLKFIPASLGWCYHGC